MRIILLLLLVIIVTPVSAMADKVCLVTDVVDGDTLRLSCDKYNGLAYLRGIDAPEYGQSFSSISTEYLRALVEQKDVIVYRINASDKSAIILLQGGKNINAKLVREGYAWAVDRVKSKENYLLRAELDARQARIGLWSQVEDNQPPWEWRKDKQ